MKVHFLVDGDVLKLVRLNDALYEELNDFHNIGWKSLQPEEAARKKAPTGPKNCTLEFPKDADPRALAVVTYLSWRMDIGDPRFTKSRLREKAGGAGRSRLMGRHPRERRPSASGISLRWSM